MKLIAFPLLRRKSQLCLVRTKWRYGKPYHYSPRGHLLVRLSRQLGISIEGAYQQLMEERHYLLNVAPHEIYIRGH